MDTDTATTTADRHTPASHVIRITVDDVELASLAARTRQLGLPAIPALIRRVLGLADRQWGGRRDGAGRRGKE